MKEKMNPYLEEVFREMCTRVGADFDKINFYKNEDGTSTDWYQDYEWTNIENDDFIKWYSNYLYTNNKARKALYGYLPKTKKACIKAANGFNLWTWKTKKELPYFHELPQIELDKLLTEGITIDYITSHFRQPDWCTYTNALHMQLGCWSLCDLTSNGTRMKISKEFCKNCECFKTELK